MHGAEGEIGEERLAAVGPGAKVLKDAIGVELGAEKALRQFLDGLAFIKEGLLRPLCPRAWRQVEVAAGVAAHLGERPVESSGLGASGRVLAQMPFAGHVGVVAGVPQQGGQSDGAVVEMLLVAGLAALVVRQQAVQVAQSY